MSDSDLREQDPDLPGPRPRAASVTRWSVDGAVAVVVTAAQVGANYAVPPHGVTPSGMGRVLGYVLLAAGAAALIARRRHPVAVLAIALGTTLWAGAEHASVVWLALIVAFFNAVLARKRAAAVVSLVIGYISFRVAALADRPTRPRFRRVRAGAGGRAAVPAEISSQRYERMDTQAHALGSESSGHAVGIVFGKVPSFR